jgi:hypothetical protein
MKSAAAGLIGSALAASLVLAPFAFPEMAFSLVEGGPPYRLQQKLGLIPRRGLGIPRRMIFFILLTWAPIMAWAIVIEQVFAGFELGVQGSKRDIGAEILRGCNETFMGLWVCDQSLGLQPRLCSTPTN